MTDAIDLLAWFYNQRAGAENLIKEAVLLQTRLS